MFGLFNHNHKETIELQKNDYRMIVSINGKACFSLDKNENEICQCHLNLISREYLEYTMVKYDKIESICYLNGYYVDRNGHKHQEKGVGVKIKNGSYMLATKCHYETYAELITHIKEYVPEHITVTDETSPEVRISGTVDPVSLSRAIFVVLISIIVFAAVYFIKGGR
jgi:hypothetical protein